MNLMEKRWDLAPPITSEAEIALGMFDDPILRQLLYNRHISGFEEAEKFLNFSGPLYDPFLLSNMDLAVKRLLQAVDRHEPIAVYGDYDVDGVTATVLMVQALRSLGAEVQEYIPHRFDEGYGVNNDALDRLYQQGVRLVVTVDCGIRSSAEARHASRLGLDLIISDHHEPKKEIPNVVAVICPKCPGDLYPDKNLAGVGLAYKIAQALYTQRPGFDALLESFLDLVAVGTVADVVPLIGENRAMVKAGLRLIRQNRRQGLHSLAGAGQFNLDTATARDIGFMIGPRLNAAGRLDSASSAYNLLMSENVDEAAGLAQELDNRNRLRQDLTKKMCEEAEAKISDEDHLLFVVSPEFNEGVVGLVAARLTESHYRPSIVGTIKNEFIRASCRSIPEFHITHALDACSDLLERHGGHAMAAGFIVRAERLPELKRRLQEIALGELTDRDLQPVLRADMDISLQDLKPEILRTISYLEPTGHKNPGVTFISRHLQVKSHRIIGSNRNHLKLSVSDGRITYDAVAFRQAQWVQQMTPTVDLLYSFERNYYQGREMLQLNVQDIKAAV
jgi:single-stranded-DNA-specific exonuclease